MGQTISSEPMTLCLTVWVLPSFSLVLWGYPKSIFLEVQNVSFFSSWRVLRNKYMYDIHLKVNRTQIWTLWIIELGHWSESSDTVKPSLCSSCVAGLCSVWEGRNVSPRPESEVVLTLVSLLHKGVEVSKSMWKGTIMVPLDHE